MASQSQYSQQDKIRLLHQHGLTIRDIARVLDCSKSGVHRTLKALGVLASPSTTIPPPPDQRVDKPSHIERGGYRYLLDNTWRDSQHVLIERCVLESKLSGALGISKDISNEYWIGGDCYLRRDLYDKVQAFNRSPCPRNTRTIECGSMINEEVSV